MRFTLRCLFLGHKMDHKDTYKDNPKRWDHKSSCRRCFETVEYTYLEDELEGEQNERT